MSNEIQFLHFNIAIQSLTILYNLVLKSLILSHSRVSLGKEFHRVAPW